MKFNLWFVIFLALVPVFILFAGLGATGGLQSSGDWQVIGMAVAALVTAGYLAGRGRERMEEIGASEAFRGNDVSSPGVKLGSGSEAGRSSPSFLNGLDSSSSRNPKREEMIEEAHE